MSDVVSRAVFFVACVSIALGLVGIAMRDTSPFIIIPPILVGCWAILSMKR